MRAAFRPLATVELELDREEGRPPHGTEGESTCTRLPGQGGLLGVLTFSLLIVVAFLVSLSHARPAAPDVLTRHARQTRLAKLPLTSGQSSFTVYSQAIELRFGEVFMTTGFAFNALPLPPEVVQRYADGSRRMAIASYYFDVVRHAEDGREESVPLHEMYVHHAKIAIGEATDLVGQGTGAEFRGTPYWLEEPYREVVTRPRGWSPFLHLINTRKPGAPHDVMFSRLATCPCSPQRRIDSTAGTIDGVDGPYSRIYPCLGDLHARADSSCSLETYAGGTRCCQHGMFVTDTIEDCSTADCAELPRDTVYFKVVVAYEDATAATVPLVQLDVIDPAGWNNEYDVQACKPGTAPRDCHDVVTIVRAINRNSDFPLAFAGQSRRAMGRRVRLQRAIPHMHTGGISLELQDVLTNRTLCKVSKRGGGLIYGKGTAAGDEAGYLVGVRPCTWNASTGPRILSDRPLRSIATYDAHEQRLGVMSQWTLYGEVSKELPHHL